MNKNLSLTPLYNQKRELETLLVTLKSQKETAERETRESAENLTAITAKIAQGEADIATLEKQAIEAVEEALRAVSGAIQAVQEGTQTVEKAGLAIKSIETRVDALISKAKEAQKDVDSRRAEINRENEVLDVRKRDLDIYRKRLQKKYDELGLGELIL